MRSKGSVYEDLAATYVAKQGIKLVGKNYTTRAGEVDLIGQSGNTLIFFEVRYRQNSRHGSPLESITPAKQKKIIRAASHYLQTTQQWHMDSRFDAIAISDHPDHGTPQIEWIKSAFIAPSR